MWRIYIREKTCTDITLNVEKMLIWENDLGLTVTWRPLEYSYGMRIR